MEDQLDLQGKLILLFKKNLPFLLLFLLSFLFIGIGLFQYFISQKAHIEFQHAESDIAGEATEAIKIFVDVAGEVKKPGVYELAEGARIKDALLAAGGLTDKASRQYLDQKINLAQKITDGAKLYFPAEGEIKNVTDGVVLNQEESSGTSGISINSASQSELESLPKIGPVTAKKIIDGRPYSALEELVSKKIISQSLFDAISHSISIY